MTYQEIIDIIEHKRRFGTASGLEVSTELLSLLHHPEHDMRIIHIAGTNGKGSTAAFISSILRAAGFCVGQFTSPHLIQFTERIQVNGQQIPRDSVVKYGQQILDLEPKLVEMGKAPTMFDICLGMALLYFQEQQCDYVILETGLGGRLDSTNAIDHSPVVTAITNIGLDHTAILGDTIEQIAREKAGIIKAGTTVVLAPMEPKAAETIISCCTSDIPVIQAQEAVLEEEYPGIVLGLMGAYQKENAALAMLAVQQLMTHEKNLFLSNYMQSLRKGAQEPCRSGCDGICNQCDQNQKMDSYEDWKKEVIRQGLEKAVWPGRMELVGISPRMILDGAHNPQGVQALAESLRALYPRQRFIFMVGVLADKDYPTMIQEMISLGEQFYTVTVESTRALQGQKLAEYITSQGVPAQPCDNIGEAMALAKEQCNNTESGGVVVFGSLYFIGSVKEWLLEHDEKQEQ